MNNVTKIAKILHSLDALRRHGNALLHGSANGDVSKLGESGNIGQTVAWKLDDWIVGQEMIRWADSIANYIETSRQEGSDDDSIAERIKRMVYGHAMQKIMSGVSNSTNPVSNVNEQYLIEAAKKIMSIVCGIEAWQFANSSDITDDIFNGIERRAKEREAAELKIISKIVYGKGDGGQYYAIPYNSAGEIVVTREIVNVPVKRKGDALTLIASFVKEQRESGNQRSILVEEVK